MSLCIGIIGSLCIWFVAGCIVYYIGNVLGLNPVTEWKD